MRSFFLTRFRQHKKHLANMAMAVAAAASLGGSAQASNVSIINADFEASGLSNYGTWPGGATYGWTPTGTRAEYNLAGQYQSPGSTGVAILYDNSGNVGITQTLGTNWQAGTYTLGALIAGYRDGSVNTIESYLMSNANEVGHNSTATISSAVSNNYNPITPLVVTIPLGSSYIGTPITITFKQTYGGGTPQTTMDNVSLSFEAVPEPGSLTLIGTALAGLALSRYRHRRSYRRKGLLE